MSGDGPQSIQAVVGNTPAPVCEYGSGFLKLCEKAGNGFLVANITQVKPHIVSVEMAVNQNVAERSAFCLRGRLPPLGTGEALEWKQRPEVEDHCGHHEKAQQTTYAGDELGSLSHLRMQLTLRIARGYEPSRVSGMIDILFRGSEHRKRDTFLPLGRPVDDPLHVLLEKNGL